MDILNFILAGFTAIIATLIAIQQIRISKHQIKVDLFDRRYEFYEKYRELLIEFIKGVDGKETAENSDAINWIYKTHDELRRVSVFLFEKNITDAIANYGEKISQLRRLDVRLNGRNSLPFGEKRTFAAEEYNNVMKEIIADKYSLESKFSKYMKLTYDDSFGGLFKG